MKNWFLLSSIFGFGLSASAEDRSSGLTQNYTVVSDLKDETIAPGNFVVEGIVKMFSSGFPLEDVLVGFIEKPVSYSTDSLGRFRLVCELNKDKQLYFYKTGWAEINIDNYPFKDQHRITLSVYMHQDNHENMIKRKPVIYLYADQEKDAEIRINPKGEFTFTYPEYKNGWNFKVNSEVTISEIKTGKKYPYLFWEASSENMFYRQENGAVPGFIISSSDVIPFLEEKLTLLGLNQKEQTDFITYWGPLMQTKENCLIQFMIDDEYENYVAEMSVHPKPDAIRRVYMFISPLDQNSIGMPVIPQDLKSFERSGFTVVEWGGSIIQLTPQKI
ncbi:MAG: hypothetical protein IPM77_05565 [Crocinitomicaceae bacterium]|nr:hypothetical protein [Crocinitomicaceae bacterium]